MSSFQDLLSSELGTFLAPPLRAPLPSRLPPSSAMPGNSKSSAVKCEELDSFKLTLQRVRQASNKATLLPLSSNMMKAEVADYLADDSSET